MEFSLHWPERIVRMFPLIIVNFIIIFKPTQILNRTDTIILSLGQLSFIILLIPSYFFFVFVVGIQRNIDLSRRRRTSVLWKHNGNYRIEQIDMVVLYEYN